MSVTALSGWDPALLALLDLVGREVTVDVRAPRDGALLVCAAGPLEVIDTDGPCPDEQIVLCVGGTMVNLFREPFVCAELAPGQLAVRMTAAVVVLEAY